MTENKTTELKREYIDAIQITVTAFANCDGRKIPIRVNDDGSMCGMDNGDSYESARSLQQNLTFEKAREFFMKRDIAFGEAQMRTMHFIGQDDNYTNLAHLLSDQCVHSIKLAVFEGSEKTTFKDRKELTGSLLSQLEDAYDFIDRYNRTRAEFSGLDRIDMRDYPTEAVREALLNAIVHREYSFSSSTLISIFDDRIEFVSIGGLIKGISLEDIELGVSVLRNEHLANIFYRLKLIEAYGTGITKIRQNYIGAAVQPKIEVTNNAFKITLPNLNYVSAGTSDGISNSAPDSKSAPKVAKEDRESAVLTLCRKNGSVSRKDVQEALNVSQSTATLLLNKMIGNGSIRKTGGGKEIRYMI